jgi:cytochrome subunit of sulfide dehydrogenase
MRPRLMAVMLLVAAADAGGGVRWAEAASPPPPGASSCSGCHAAGKSVETPVPGLIGRKPDEIESAMTAFRTGQRPASVMDRIAKGFSDDEIKAIAIWYAGQTP